MNQNLTQRVFTGLAITVYVFLAAFLRGWVLYISTALIAVLSVQELTAALKKGGWKPSAGPAYLMSVLLIPAVYFRGAQGIAILAPLSIAAALSLSVLRRDMKLRDVLASVALVAYTPICCGLLALLDRVEPKSASTALIGLTYATSWGSDMFAYFVGLRFGKTKLIPHISPKKTVEGALGGLLGAVAMSTVIGVLLVPFDTTIALYHYPVLGALGSVSAQFGDLVASAIKRECGIKDYGTFFPGHGGIMDRLDGTFFTIIAIVSYSMMIGWI